MFTVSIRKQTKHILQLNRVVKDLFNETSCNTLYSFGSYDFHTHNKPSYSIHIVTFPQVRMKYLDWKCLRSIKRQMTWMKYLAKPFSPQTIDVFLILVFNVKQCYIFEDSKTLFLAETVFSPFKFVEVTNGRRH